MSIETIEQISGSGFLESPEPEVTEDACLAAIKDNDKSAVGYYFLGKIRIKQGRLDEARVLLETAYSLDRFYIPHGLVLGDVYYALERPDEAVGVYKELLGLYPNDEQIIDLLRRHYEGLDIDRTFEKIRTEVDEIIEQANITAKKKVLFGMPFSIYEPCRVHDFYLSQALKLRGAKIIPLSVVSENNDKIESVEEGENKFFGGVWGGFTGVAEDDKLIAEKNCRIILESNRVLWERWASIPLVSLTDYISEDDREQVRQITQTYLLADYKQWRYNSMPVGRWAIDALVNNEMVGDERLVINWEQKLYNYLYNIMLLIQAVSRSLDDIQPDVIITSDTYYYPYAILESLGKERSIPCYNHWEGTRSLGWCYARGEPSMNLGMDDAWKYYNGRGLSEHESGLIADYLEIRCPGCFEVLPDGVARSEKLKKLQEKIPQLDLSKPTVLLATNAIWDLRALNKDILFESMTDWLRSVLDFFVTNRQYQLIIKAHPIEKQGKIPVTRQMIGEEIRKYKAEPGTNIIFIEPDSSVSAYDLISLVDVGLVYTTTLGLEMSCFGKPVVTCAHAHYRDKGFTYDPCNAREYFEIIKKILDSGEAVEVVQQRSELAKKFFYLYFFRYYASLNLLEHKFGDPVRLLVSSAAELMSGRNPVLDYITDSIMNELPIVSESRMPPMGGYNRNQYEFSQEQVIAGSKLVFRGYPQNLQTRVIERCDDLSQMRTGDFNYFVPVDCFKNGELTWMYNETFLGPDVNPHGYETAFVKIRQGDIVIDAGSCEGFFVRYALDRGAGKIVAFEPHPRLSEGLRQTYETEIGRGRVEIVPFAISNVNCESNLDDGREFVCEASINVKGKNRIEVVTLDSFLMASGLERIDFVKMDIEGQEMNAVRGMFGILKRFKPRLAIAVYHGYDNARQVKELILAACSDYKIEFGGCYMFEAPSRPYMVYAY